MFSEISQVRFISVVLRIVVEAVMSPDGAVDAAQCHPMHIIFSYHSPMAIVDEGRFSAGVNGKKFKSLFKGLHYDRPFVHLVLVGKVQKQPRVLSVQDGFG